MNSTKRSSDPNVIELDQQFAQDVRKGLSARPKKLPSKYFYDDEGSRLFQKIMELPEYYLTRTEYAVLDSNKEGIYTEFSAGGKGFDLIELGAGDGLKTKILLRHFLSKGADFSYLPVDISGDALAGLEKALAHEMPELSVRGIQDDYFSALSRLKAEEGERTRIVLFLGSNVGNFKFWETVEFLERMKAEMKPGDMVMIGFDLRKDPNMILSAYNDVQGVTRAFNMNLLTRMNRELGANFDLTAFEHYPFYDPIEGEARSCLVSKKKQSVYIEALDAEFDFENAEIIKTEVSRKYFEGQVESLAKRTGFQKVAHFFDPNRYFLDALWRV